MARPFRLQSLLDHKQQLEDESMRVLAERERERTRAADVLTILHDVQEKQLQHLEDLARVVSIDAAERRDATSYLERIERSIVVQHDVIAEAEARVAESRDALVEILKEKRALERLRQQHVETTAREEGRREANAADEISTARYTRTLQERG
mgnify:CR=1 FL=1